MHAKVAQDNHNVSDREGRNEACLFVTTLFVDPVNYLGATRDHDEDQPAACEIRLRSAEVKVKSRGSAKTRRWSRLMPYPYS
jgi:hypothetical protein